MQFHAISKFMAIPARPLFKGEKPDCAKCPDCAGCNPEQPKAPIDNKDLSADKFVKIKKPENNQ